LSGFLAVFAARNDRWLLAPPPASVTAIGNPSRFARD
jgi:hypothetical protein